MATVKSVLKKGDSLYQEIHRKVKSLMKKLRACRRAKREQYRQIGRIIVDAEQKRGGTDYGERVMKQLAKDFGIHHTTLYKARRFALVDPGEKSKVAGVAPDLSFTRVRKIVSIIETPEQLDSLLADYPDLDTRPDQAFDQALDQWQKKADILPASEEEEEGEDPAQNEDLETEEEEGTEEEVETEEIQEPSLSPRDNERDSDEYPAIINDVLASLQFVNPELAEKVDIESEEGSFTITLNDLTDERECWIICNCFARILKAEEEGEQ